MEAILPFIVIIIIILIAFIIFTIYFIFKIIQFVIQAVNLYKKIIVREDAIINLLIDIRDNTKKFDITKKIVEEVDEPTSKKLVTQKNKYNLHY